MSTKGNEFTRRTALKVAGGAVAAGFSLPWTAGAAFAQQTSTLRAGIVGFNVINTLDPMKATLIPEFYVIYASVQRPPEVQLQDGSGAGSGRELQGGRCHHA